MPSITQRVYARLTARRPHQPVLVTRRTSRLSHRAAIITTIAAAGLMAQAALGQAFSGTYTFGSDGNVSSFAYNGTPISNLTVANLTKNGVTSSSSANNFRASNWGTGSTNGGDVGGSIDTDKYFEFTITAQAGYTISNPTITFGVGRSATGPRQFVWKSSLDSYSAAIPVTASHASVTVASNVIQTPDADSGYTGNTVSLTTSGQTTITVRLYIFGAEGTTGTGGLQENMTFAGTLVAVATGPDDPGSFTATALSAQQVDLAWTKNGAGNNVMVTFSTTDSFGIPTDGTSYSFNNSIGGATVIYNGSGTSYNHTERDANTTYYYKAWSVDGDSNYSAGLTANATTDSLSAPASHPASAININTFTAAWDPVTGATGYRLDVSTNESFVGANVTVVGWNFNEDTLAAHTGLAINASQVLTNVEANAIGFITRATGNLAASASGWNDGDETKYWQVSFDASGIAQLAVSAVQRSSSTGPRDFKLQYRVGADGTWTDVAGGTLQTGDNYTTGLLSNVPIPEDAADQAEVFLRWIMTSNTSVGEGTVAGGGTSAIDDIIITGKYFSYLPAYENRDVSGAGTSELVVTGLVSNTEYFYRVRATNATSTSANSTTQSVTTLVLPAPESRAASNIGGDRFVANWSAVPEADGYLLDISTNNAFADFQTGYENRDVGNIIHHTVTGLVVEVTYHYRVRAYDAGSASVNSATQQVDTVLKPEPSNHASEFHAAVTTHRTIALEWTDATGDILPDAYIVRGSTNGYDDILTPANESGVGNLYTWNPRYAHRVEHGEERDEVSGSSSYGLTPGQTYYFKIFPVTNTGTNSLYKTDGSVPQLSVTTLADVPFEDFERGDGIGFKIAFEEADVTLRSGDWRLNDVLIGSLDQDKKSDQRALRMRHEGFAEMLFNVSMVDSILLDYASFSSDSPSEFKLELSIDNGTTWNQVGGDIATSSSVQTAEFTVDRAAPMRFRIVKVSIDENAINIDNIRLTPFNAKGSVFRFR